MKWPPESTVVNPGHEPNLHGTQRETPDIPSTGFTNAYMSPTYRVFERLLWFLVDGSKRVSSELQQVGLYTADQLRCDFFSNLSAAPTKRDLSEPFVLHILTINVLVSRKGNQCCSSTDMCFSSWTGNFVFSKKVTLV